MVVCCGAHGVESDVDGAACLRLLYDVIRHLANSTRNTLKGWIGDVMLYLCMMYAFAMHTSTRNQNISL